MDINRHEFRARGKLRALEPKVFDLLRHLIENHDRLVSRDELMEVIWKGRIVSESTVDGRMHAARRAVDDDGRRQARIKTVQRRGYRFIAEVEVVQGEDGSVVGNQASGPNLSPAFTDKPSIAVLPFVNVSGDPKQEYFTDGMTEDIITGLSRFRSLFVISRGSTFAYKGKSLDVREVAHVLGVRYVLEGSVRHGGDRIRITGQLVDAETGNDLWAKRYDRELADIFAVQDEVTAAIVGAIAPEISDVERERALREPPKNLNAWGLYQRGLADFYRSTGEGYRSSIGQFDRANELDPTFAPAFAMAAFARALYVLHFAPDDSDEVLNHAREKARKGTVLDSRDPACLWSDARVHSMLGHHDVAIAKAEDAIELNPNDATSHQMLGVVLCSAGRAEEAIPHLDHAIRLSPRNIFLTSMLTFRAVALFDLERYEESLEVVRRASRAPRPRTMTFALLAAVLTKLGRRQEARESLDDLLAHAPEASCGKFQKNQIFGSAAVMQRFVDALREAGLPK